jgi:hypothetical protein
MRTTWAPNTLQILISALCHKYCRATRTVSIVARCAARMSACTPGDLRNARASYRPTTSQLVATRARFRLVRRVLPRRYVKR